MANRECIQNPLINLGIKIRGVCVNDEVMNFDGVDCSLPEANLHCHRHTYAHTLDTVQNTDHAFSVDVLYWLQISTELLSFRLEQLLQFCTNLNPRQIY